MAQAAVKDTTGYVNYVYNISARGTTEVASQLMGLSGMATNILGQLAFQTSSYLSTTEGALLSMGIVATAGFGKAIKQATEFDQALSTIGAISGKTRGEVEDLGNDAMAMSSKFGVAVSEMTQGLESLARAGVSQNNMSAILEEAMGLSKLEGLSLDTAINDLISTTNLLDTQNLDLSSPEYADAVKYQNQKITATSEAAPINAQDIIHTLEHIGGYASSTNLDQDDLYAVIAQLGSKGTKSEMAGTSLRAFISAGQKDTAQRALERIGLNVKDLWKNDETILSISDMKDVLDEAMESRGYTQQEKLEFYSDFAGYKQANQIMKIDTSSVREFKQKIDESWNIGQKIGQVIGTAETHIQGLLQAGTNLLTKVGEPFLPIISTIAFTLKTGIDIINAIPGSNLIIAGGLILASVKAISTIFNKIAPQIIAAKGNIGGIRGLFMGIREDLSETYTLIKNINNADFIQQKARENEATHITDRDKIEYWREETNEHLNGMFDVKQLEIENDFVDDQPYIDWKMEKAKEPIKEEKSRNQRESSKNPPKGANESSNNRVDNKAINLTNIEKLLTDIKTLMPPKKPSEENTKTTTDIEQKIKIDDSVVKDLKNHTFKVVVTNPFTLNRIVPVHEVGSVEWNKQKHEESKVDKLITRQDNIVFKNMNSAGSASDDGIISINKKTGRSQQKRTSFHEAGHVLLDHPKRTKSLPKITLDDEDKQVVASLKMHNPKRFEEDSRSLIKEFEAELFQSEIARKTGQKNTAFSQKFLASVRRILIKHDVINEVRFDKINTLSNVLADRSYEYQQKIDLVRDEQIKKDKKQKERPNSHLWKNNETYDKYIDTNYIANKKDKLEALRKTYGGQKERKKSPKPYSEKDRDQKKRNTYDRNRNDINLRKEFGGQANIEDFSDFALLDDGILTEDKIDQFINMLNIDFGFDTSTTEGKKSQDFMLQYAKDLVKWNLQTGHINLSGESPERLKQRITNELHGSIFSFGENKLGSIVASMPDVKTYTTNFLQEEIGALPDIYYGEKSKNDKLADLELDYDKIVKKGGPLNGGADYLRALAHFGGVNISDVDTPEKGGDKYRSKMANKIKQQLDNGNLDELYDAADLLDDVLSNQIAYHYMNDLSSDQQKEFMKSVGLSTTGNAYIDMGRYLQKGSSAEKDLETIQSIGNIVELDKDKLNTSYGAYRRDLTPGQNVKNKIDPLTERAIKMLGVEGFKGVGSHIKKVTDAIVELTIQNGITEIKKEMEQELGRKVSTSEVIRNMPNLHIPYRRKIKQHTGTIDDIGMGSPDRLDLKSTIYAGAQQMHDDSVGGNEVWKTGTEGGGFQTLQRAQFVAHPDDDGIIFEDELNKLSNMSFESAMAGLRLTETRKALQKTGTAELEALPFVFEGQQIKGVFKRLPTHNRDMKNTAVIRDEEVLDENGKPIIGPNGEPLTQPMLQGYLQNDKGDYREAYSWALERRRNRFFMQGEQNKIFGHMALKYGLSRADIMSTPLTQLQMNKINEQYENQDFVNISQYKKKYDDLYNAATPEQQKLMMTGEEALRQLRGEMAAAEKVTLDKKGNVISKGNIFHEWVTPAEYQRRLSDDLIYTEEGNKGILETKKDKEGNTLYKINDFEALHYSKQDIARKTVLEDVLWSKKLQSSYNDLTNNGAILDEDNITDFTSFMDSQNLSAKDIAEKLLASPEEELKTLVNAIYLYNKDLYDDVISELQWAFKADIKNIANTPEVQKVQKTKNLNTAFDMLEKYIPGVNEAFSTEDRKYISEEFDPFATAVGMARQRGLEVSDELLNNDFTDLFNTGETFASHNTAFSENKISDKFNSVIADVMAGDYSVNTREQHYSTLANVIDEEMRENIEAIANGGEYLSELGMSVMPRKNDSADRVLKAKKILDGLLEEDELKNHEAIKTYMGSIQNAGLSGDTLNLIQSLGSYEDIVTAVSPEDAMSMLPNDAGSGMLLLPPASEEPISTPETIKEGSAERDVSARGNVNTATPPDVIEAQRLPLDREAYLRSKAFVSGVKQKALGMVSPYNQEIYDRFGNKDNSELENRIGGFSDKVANTTDQLQGFSTFLQEASEAFPPLIGAVIALDGVIGTLTTVQKGTQGLQSFLQIGESLRAGEQIEFLNNKFSSDSAAGKMLMSMTGMIGETVEKLTAIFFEFLGPIALITAALGATKIALDWSYQSHEKYLKSLEEDQKEKRSKAKGLQTTNENAQEQARNNRAPRQQAALDRNAQLAQTRLDNANMSRSYGAIEIARQKNDTLWGDYGIAAGLGKLQGNYESTVAEYDGTSGQIRRIKEATLANPFSSDAMNQVASYYDANQLAFGVMDEYKDELGKLYDAETSAMLKYHSDDVRGSPEFEKALDDFVEATGITRDHAKQYLDYMQTEHEVDKATQAMQAQADQIAASTELKVQAIAFGGNPADVLGLNGIEAQQGAMIKAQADMVKMELSGQLWWKAVWSTITTPVKLILSPLFIITDLLSAIWSFITGNWGDAFDKAGKAGSRLNVFGEAATYWGAWADVEGTDFNAIGQGATDSYNRANYGNVEQPASGGYHPTHYLDTNANQDRRESVGGGYSGGQPPRGGYFDHRESQTHYINANRGSYHFMNNGRPEGNQPMAQLSPLASIGSMLSTIISILTTGLLVGGGIYGLTKFLKSDLSLGDIGGGILSTLKGDGPRILGDIFDGIFKEGTIMGKLKDKISPFTNSFKDSFGARKDQIKEFFGFDSVKDAGSGVLNKGSEVLGKIDDKVGFSENPIVQNWKTYFGSKLVTDEFSKKKRKGMNASDRDFLIEKYGLDINLDEEDEKGRRKYRTADQKNKAIRQELDKQGKWDEAMGELYGRDYVDVKDAIGSRINNVKEQYANPWKEYLGGKVDERKQKAKESFWAIKEEAEWYRNTGYSNPDGGIESSLAKILGRGLGYKDEIFGKASQTDFSALIKDPRAFLSDPRNIESMAKDLYAQHKDKIDNSDFMATVGAYRERPDIMENAPIHAKLMGKALDWKDKYLQGDSIQDVLKDPERTVDILQGTWKDLNGGALDDLNIADTVKDKVSGFFDNIKEGAEEGVEEGDDGKGGSGGLLQKAKQKLAGFFGLNKGNKKKCPRCGFENEPDDIYCAECGQKLDGEVKPLKDTLTTEGVKDKMNMLKNQGRLTPWFGEDEGALGSTDTKGVISLFPDVLRRQEGGLGANIAQTTFHEVAHNLLGHNREDRAKTNFEERDDDWEGKATELEAEMASVGAMQDLGLEVPEWNLKRLDRMKKQARKKAPHGGVNLELVDAARKEMVENADFILGSINNVMSFQTAMDDPWTLDEISDVQGFIGKKMSDRSSPNDDDSIMPTLFERGRIYQKDDVTFGGHLMNKAPIQSTVPMSTGGIVSEEPSALDLIDTDLFDKMGGKGGKVGKVLKGIGGKAKGGIGKLAKGGAGKLAKSGIGKAVSGIGKKAIGGIGKKLATKGLAQVGSKVLGGALMATGIGAPLGLLLESPIGGMLMEGAMDLGGKALGAVGGAIGGVGKAIGGFLGFGPKTHYQKAGQGGGGLGALGAMMPGVGALGAVAGGIGGMLGGLFGGGQKGTPGLMSIANPLSMGVGLLGSIFKNNRDHKNKSGSIGDIAQRILKNVVDGNKKKPASNGGGSITIQNININTADDPEAIKAMFLELLIELQEQVNPRLVSRTVGEPPANSSTTDTSTTETENTENTEEDKLSTNSNLNTNTQ